ncbi:MAG TPA: glycine--tRNA ligase subunit beta [Chloroflexi bacterium]|nr:glycine--tRNA ligase subunit beta [Chloroflexota bacterium]
MSKPLTFQQVILRLQEFWADRGSLIWQPYSEKVGAGTANPATILRVLGPEPWNVAYVEPSYRPDDGRYGENPNRMQMHIQFQVILKPDPGNPQERYLQSLEALGIRREEHDIRFVEDNWESPALGAWGLGWEVWLDGLEITQFTYFQQAGGLTLDPPAVEITYGLERITMFLQRVRSVWEIDWDGVHTYGDVLLDPEVEHCRYDFEVADVDSLRRMYDLFETEARRCLEAGLVVPAHDYVLRCSHTFNLLDSRGAVGVTERATFFRRMRDLARQVAQAYVEQRKRKGFPWLERPQRSRGAEEQRGRETEGQAPPPPCDPATLLLEIGTEELPARDLSSALAQLREKVPALLEEHRLDYEGLRVLGTPRRLVVLIEGLAPRQRPVEEVVKGPPVHAAFDADGKPTKAAEGFARKQGVAVEDLEVREVNGGQYVVAIRRREGRPTPEVLAEILPALIADLHFPMSMRWNETGVAFSRPVRWLVALLGEHIIPFEYAGIATGRTTRGSRPEGSPALEIPSADAYLSLMAAHHIVVDPEERRSLIAARVEELAASVGGRVPDDPALLEEVTNLVEQPTPFLGRFEEKYLALPAEVLIAVMKKHQRYFPVVDAAPGDSTEALDSDGAGSKGAIQLRPYYLRPYPLRPYFIAVRNGGEEHLDVVRRGNEEVIRARFADADYFYREDTKQPLEAFLPRLDTLTFQEQLGSMLAKTRRLESLVPEVARMVGLDEAETQTALRAARLCKADLATQMVVEFTSLQGVMGREYALKSGEPPEVAQAIFEHYLPRFAGDALPETPAGLVVGLADRLDSLAGLFAVGLAPTGSADPYGLRRAALGLVQNLIAAEVPFSVRRGLEAAARLLPIDAPSDALEQAWEFVVGRLRVYLREQGFRYDVVEAVLAARGDDPYRAKVGVEQLSRWVEREDWPRILDNYARCVRITRDFEERFPLDPDRFVRPAEEELYAAYQEAREQVTPESSVDEFLTAFLPLVDVIDRFFAKESGVLVMAEDRALRENRLALLQHVASLAEGIVDLSRLEGF